jgi:hypothetical protein
VNVLTTARHVSKDACPPETGAFAKCAVGAEGIGAEEGAARRGLSPKPLNTSRESRRDANTAAPPINNPGMSATSTIAAPAATAARVATPPMTPGPETEIGYQLLACVKDVVKELSPSSRVAVGRYKWSDSQAVNGGATDRGGRAARWAYPTPDGTCIRDYAHVNDLADAHVAAIDWISAGKPSDSFNLGNGRGFSVAEVVKASEEVTGRSVPTEMCARRLGDPPVLVSDSSEARELLGWMPTYPDPGSADAHACTWFRDKMPNL